MADLVHKSTNGGRTWTELPTGLVRGTRVTDIRIDPTNPAIVYASTFGLQSGGGSNYLETQFGVLKSLDGGATWQSMKTGLGPGLTQQAIFRMDLSPRDPRRLIVSVGDTSYFRSHRARRHDHGIQQVVADLEGQPSEVAHVPVVHSLGQLDFDGQDTVVAAFHDQIDLMGFGAGPQVPH